MKICQKGHKTQKNGIKISLIRLKEVMFTVLRSTARIFHWLWKILRRRASVCLPLLETLMGLSFTFSCWGGGNHPLKSCKATRHTGNIVPYIVIYLFVSLLPVILYCDIVRGKNCAKTGHKPVFFHCPAVPLAA